MKRSFRVRGIQISPARSPQHEFFNRSIRISGRCMRTGINDLKQIREGIRYD